MVLIEEYYPYDNNQSNVYWMKLTHLLSFIFFKHKGPHLYDYLLL